MKPALKRIAIVALIIMTCFVINFCANIKIVDPNAPTPTTTLTPKPTRPKPTATPNNGDAISARYDCQEFVRDRLKSPSSADFGNITDDKATTRFITMSDVKSEFGDIAVSKAKNKRGAWLVKGEAEAQNSFGVMLRLNYYCVMNYDADTWYLLDIQVTE